MLVYLVKNDGASKPIHLQENQKIGSGGMGSVWRVGNLFGTGNMVVKIFHDPKDPKTTSEAKLWSMIRNPPEHIAQTIGGVTYTQFAWPQYIVTDDHQQFIGYAMPEVDIQQSMSLVPFTQANEGKKILTPYQDSLYYRIQLGANISALMEDLHQHGHAFIDFKELNLRLMPERNNRPEKGFIVCFIDCDDYLITDEDNSYPCSVISAEMTSPEYHQHQQIQQLDKYHDRFVLAIILFKILNYEIHPFTGIPVSDWVRKLPCQDIDERIEHQLYAYGIEPSTDVRPLRKSIHTFWDDKTRQMFDKAFLSKDPKKRPSAGEWRDHLRGLIQNYEATFTRCKKYPQDTRHIYFLGKNCYRCAMEQGLTDTSYNATSNNPNIATASAEPTINNNVATTATPKKDVHIATASAEPTINNNVTTTATPKKDAHIATASAEPIIEVDRPAPNQQKFINNKNNSATQPQVAPNTPPRLPTQGQTQSKLNGWVILAGLFIMLFVGVMFYNSITTEETNNTSAQPTQQLSEYQQIMNDLPKKTENINKQLRIINQQGGAGKELTLSSASTLYQNTLDLSPDFFNQVMSVAKQSHLEVEALVNAAISEDIAETQRLAKASFRNADMKYFLQYSVNKTLAKQLNDEAKNQFWEQKNRQSALYLQAKAVKNRPLHSEYVANLAFYLFKNNYPYTKKFVLYALQTPRNSDKFPNTYMMELLAGLAVKEGDEETATGLLLTQFYTVKDKDERCKNMRKYSENYPDLVPIAEQVFEIIARQDAEGKFAEPIPDVCLSVF